MFGIGKTQGLEAKISELKEKLEQALRDNDSLKKNLESARNHISELETKLAETESEQLKRQLQSSIAEYEGLKELYTGKIQEFNSTHEEKEQEFARHQAVERYNLENEIADNRQANQDYVSNGVRTFSESFNYYLHQIRLLMDALGDVATRTGETLFSEPNDDLKAKIGQQMAEKLKAETDPLRNDTGDMILIGTPEKAEEEPETEEILRETESTEETLSAFPEEAEPEPAGEDETDSPEEIEAGPAEDNESSISEEDASNSPEEEYPSEEKLDAIEEAEAEENELDLTETDEDRKPEEV